MAVLPILIAPHPTLKRRAEPVQEVDAEIRQLTEDMLETMYDAPGVGLAAPQVDVAKRVVVIDCAEEDEGAAELVAFGPSGWHGLSRSGLIASRGGREVCAVKS